MMKIKIVGLLVPLMFFMGCIKYSFKGALPSDIKTIFIPVFENKAGSPVPETDERLTRIVTEKFLDDNTLTLVNTEKGADLILAGTIRRFNRGAENVAQGEVVSRYKLDVTVEVDCINTRTNQSLWKGTLVKTGYYEDETGLETAFDEAIELLAEEILNKTIAAW